MEIFLILVLIGLVILNIYASYKISTNPSISKSQRVTQLALTWIFPFFGAIGCISFHSSETAYDHTAFNRSAFVENGSADSITYGNHSDSDSCSGGGGGSGGDSD